MCHINIKLHDVAFRANLFSSLLQTFPWRPFIFPSGLWLSREKGAYKGLFDKEPVPPQLEIQNFTAPSSSPWDPIEAGDFNVFIRAEDISLFRNQVLEVDDDMEPSPDYVPWGETPSSDTLFEG